MGFRVLMYAGGLVGAGVYLANLRQVRGLTDTAVELEEELAENDLGPDRPCPPSRPSEQAASG